MERRRLSDRRKCRCALAFALALASPAFSQALFQWKVYAPINFNLTNSLDRAVRIDLEGAFASTWSRQEVGNAELRYNARPVRSQETTNACGDRSILAVFRPVRTGWWTGTVSYERGFLLTRSLAWEAKTVPGTFPLPAALRGGHFGAYLGEADGVGYAATPLERKANELAYHTGSAIEALAGFAAWNHRCLRPEPDGGSTAQDAGSVFERKTGTLHGRLRVLAAMARAAGIPARFAHGRCLDTDVDFTTDGSPCRRPGGRGDHWWIEAWVFTNLGESKGTETDGVWLPLDLQGTAFFMWPNVGRLRASACLSNLLDAPEGFTEMVNECVSNAGRGPVLSALVRPLFPPVASTGGEGIASYLDRLASLMVLPAKNTWKVDGWSVGSVPGNVRAETLRIEAGSAESWAERIVVSETQRLSSVEALLRRMDSQGGTLVLEVSKESNGAAGSGFRSELPTWKLGEGGLWRWGRFSLIPSGKESLVLEPGTWWFVVRLKGDGMIHWAAESEPILEDRASWRVDAAGRPVRRLDARFCLRRGEGK